MRRASLSSILLIPTICTTILSCLPCTNAYIPAQAVNDTSRLNLTDASTILISWVLPAGVYRGPVYVHHPAITIKSVLIIDRISCKRMFPPVDRLVVLLCIFRNRGWDRMYRLQHLGSRISRAMSTRRTRVRKMVLFPPHWVMILD